MKAALCTSYGPPEVVRIGDVPKPEPRADELLVRVHCAAVNSGDIRVRTLEVKEGFRPAMRLVFGWRGPRNPILGNVFSGTVEQAGASVTAFRPGDRVYGCTQGLKFGCHAKYVAIRASAPVARMPEGATFKESVSLLFGGTTALHFLGKAKPVRGQSILVYGASGAVGTSCVQIARIMGLAVTAVTSGKNENLVRSLGADAFLDYTTRDFPEKTATYDIVFDAVGKLDKKTMTHLTSKGGRAVSVGGLDVAMETKNQLKQLSDWYEEGRLRAVIDRTYPLEGIKEAHAYVEEGHKKGNVVIEILAGP